jgi:hypothetical protein
MIIPVDPSGRRRVEKVAGSRAIRATSSYRVAIQKPSWQVE